MTRIFHHSEFTPMKASYKGEDVLVHCMGDKWAVILRENGNAEMIVSDHLKIVVKKRVYCHSLGAGRFEINESPVRSLGPGGNASAVASKELEFYIPVVDKSDDDDY